MSLSTAIQKTIDYSANFGGKLSLKQLHFRLLSDKIYTREQIKNYQLRIKNYQVNTENLKKIKLARELVKKHLIKFKDILMVGITGSVAAENAKIEEDIDIFIVCKRDTLWWTRLKLRFYIKFNNIPHRKYRFKEQPNDFCFNLWMDESNLTVPKLKQNEKNAVDLILIKPIFDKNKTYEKLIEGNGWVKKYVANGYSQLKITNYELRIGENKTGIIERSLNYVAFVGQLLYIRLKGPVKFINLRQAFFHK